jgi:predicted dehydrogenase
MIRLALIGCGEHAEGGHAIPLARYRAEHVEELELTAACDVHRERAEKFCGKYGFQSAYSDLNEMLAREKVDACVIVVPTDRISALSIEVLSRGTPCVVEKPLGSTLAEARALREAAGWRGTPNMVSVNRRFMPFLNGALEWVRRMGEVRYVHCTFVRHARSEAEFIWGTAIHAVDTLRYIAGPVQDWRVRIFESKGPAVSCAIDLEFKNGSSGRIDVLPAVGIAEETYELFGDGFRASITCPFGPERGWRAYCNGSLVEKEVAAPGLPEDVVNGYYHEAAAFIRALSNGSTLQSSIEDVYPSVEICFEIAKAVQSEART